MAIERVTKWRTSDGEEHPDEPTALREQKAIDLAAAITGIYAVQTPVTLAKAIIAATNEQIRQLLEVIQRARR